MLFEVYQQVNPFSSHIGKHEPAFLSHLFWIAVLLPFDSLSTHNYYLHSDTDNWPAVALTLAGETAGRADIMRAVLPCGGRKRAL